jgi:hypothetical protein
MYRTKLLVGLGSTLVWLVAGCGGGGDAEVSAGLEGVEGPTSEGESGNPGDGDGDNSGDGDGDNSGDGDGDDPGDGDGDNSGGPKFDTTSVPDGSAAGCGGGGSNNVEFSYIWIANSSQGTLSKIDTETLEEVGRYQVRPDGAGLPSRTSVNLSGDVAVASRTGGVTKVYARQEDCEESNGTPGIQSSTGANDILAWGQEECIAWHTPMQYDSQRPIAWTQGNYNQGSCVWSEQKVWTTGTSGQGGYADVMRLNGDDGSLDAMVTVQGLESFNSYGGYGAVVDADGNLWFNEMFVFGDQLVRVDADDLSYELIPTAGRSGYGIAIDEDGRLWTCGSGTINRYDPDTQQWMSTNTSLTYGGCMVDAEGRLWASGANSSPYSVVAYDVDTVSQLYSYPMTEHLHGISIDFAGYVWGVGGEPGVGNGQRAFRIDPDDGSYDTVEGLTGAYTYSDMTGFALASSIAG